MILFVSCSPVQDDVDRCGVFRKRIKEEPLHGRNLPEET